MATHSSTLAQKIPWTEEPGAGYCPRGHKQLDTTERLKKKKKGFPDSSIGKESVGNAGDTGLVHGLGRRPGKGNGNPLQYSCLENSMDRGAWQAIVHGVARV